MWQCLRRGLIHGSLFFMTIGGCLLLSPSLGAQSARVRVALVEIVNPSMFSKSNIGNSLVDQLDSDISAAGKYTLLERSALEAIEKEQNLGQSDLADPKSFAAKGGLKGADFLLIGKISQYTYHETSSQRTEFTAGRAVAVVYYNHIANVQINIEVADPRTGEDVQSVSGKGTANTTSRASFNAEWNSYVSSHANGNFADLHSLLTEAADLAMQNAASQLNDIEPDLEAYLAKASVGSEVSSIGTGKILAAVGQGQFVIGVASTSNLKVGDRFNVIAEVPIKNTQGVVVYQEKRTVGAVQITNISESTKALAQQVNTSASGASAQITEGDTLVFDEKYGESLRGVASAGSGATSSGGSATGGSAASAQAYIQRGSRFMDNQEYSEALNQYREGLAIDPKNGKLLAGKAEAEIGIDDFMDAEDDADMAIAAGGSVDIPAYHIHTFGHCEGMLVIEKGKVSYQPTTGNDNFTATSKSQISILQKDFPAQGMRVPDLWINTPDQGGKERKYEMIFPMFLPHPSPNMAINFQVTPDAANKTKRLDGMIVRLINASLQ